MLLLSYPSPFQSSAFDFNNISGLYAHWHADTITGKVDGDIVTSWIDSKNGIALNQGATNTGGSYRPSGPGGKPYLDMSDGQRWMSAPSVAITSGFTMFLVFAPQAALSSGPRIVEFNNATAANQGRMRFTASGWGMFAGSNAAATSGPQTASGTYVQGAWIVAATRWQAAANAHLIYNGTTRTSAGDMSLTTPTGFYLGSSITGSNRSSMYVAEILVYNASLSNADETTVLTALNSKYGGVY